MKKIILFSFVLSFSLVFSQTYCAGDQISEADQNLIHVVGAGDDDYEIGNEFRLSDFNGELNGGNYHVIFIDMSASWWGPCQSNAPIVDGLEEDWNEYGVKFVTSLSDAGQPYSCEQWQSNFGNSDTPLVLDENQSGTGMFSLLHDSWNAFPTFALLDHTMTVRAKPWTLDNNTNTSSCDGTNTTIDGWSGGSTSDFIEQLVEECGVLCEGCSGDVDTDGDGIADECDDCLNMSGDVNDDMVLDILDIISTVNMILNGGMNAPGYTDCEKIDADFDTNGVINILDVISIINTILDARIIEIRGSAELNIIDNDNSSNIVIKSDTPFSGVEISFYSGNVIPQISLNNNSNIMVDYKTEGEITRVIAYSLTNTPFRNNEAEFIFSNIKINSEMLNVVVGSPSGHELELTYSISDQIVQSGPYKFELNRVFPNPFNPITTIDFTLPEDNLTEISIYNLLGERIETIFSGFQSKGSYSYQWDASNHSSGIYYINLKQGQNIQTTKVVLMK